MVLGKNKGHKYEDKVFALLEKMELLYPRTTQEGMAGGVDAVFCHLGKPYYLEVKNGLGADYGQKKFSWNEKDGWTFSEDDDVTRFFTDHLAALAYVRRKGITPQRYSKPKDTITYADAAADQKAFEDRTFIVKAEALWRYYSEKGIHYIQVGNGYGFYHLDADVAGLGTPQFDCDFVLRFRAKYHDRLDRQRGTLAPTPWNYSFFAVLRVKGKPKRSKYNFEKGKNQEFPPIKP